MYLAREDGTERAERVVQRLVVDALLKVLDEDISDAGLAL
jgi:hypothetical protein